MVEFEPRLLKRPINGIASPNAIRVFRDNQLGTEVELVLQSRMVYERDENGNVVTATKWQDVPVTDGKAG